MRTKREKLTWNPGNFSQGDSGGGGVRDQSKAAGNLSGLDKKKRRPKTKLPQKKHKQKKEDALSAAKKKNEGVKKRTPGEWGERGGGRLVGDRTKACWFIA